MSLKVFSIAHKCEVTVSALIDPAQVKWGEVSETSKKYKVGSGAPAAYKGHNGIDLVGKDGCPIFSITDGTVHTSTYESGGAGNYVSIKSTINGVERRLLYMHLKYRSELKKGDKVKAGQLIGYQGSTGNSTGSHLHISIRNSENKNGDPFDYVTYQERGFCMKYETGVYKIIVSALRIRKAPSLESETVGTSKMNETVNVTAICIDDKSGAWGKIGAEKWVCLELAGGDRFVERIGDLPENDQSEVIKKLETDISVLKDNATKARSLINEASEILEV